MSRLSILLSTTSSHCHTASADLPKLILSSRYLAASFGNGKTVSKTRVVKSLGHVHAFRPSEEATCFAAQRRTFTRLLTFGNNRDNRRKQKGASGRHNDIVAPDSRYAMQQLKEIYAGDQDLARQEFKWLQDKQRFDEGASHLSLRDLVTTRVKEIQLARNMDNGNALRSLIGPSYSLEAAILELKWIEEHVTTKCRKPEAIAQRVNIFCRRRHKGYPLQYILGTEYFGDLKLTCHEKVLIPRQDTADHVMHILERIRTGQGQLPEKLRVLDLCSGSGCMGLLMAHSFPYKEAQKRGLRELEVIGIDHSGLAVKLSRKNQKEVLRANWGHPPWYKQAYNTLKSMSFREMDILDDKFVKKLASRYNINGCDIVIANPPYLAEDDLETTVALSVQRFEPRKALVPPATSESVKDQADIFYKHIIKIAMDLKAKLILMETGSRQQSERQIDLIDLFRANDQELPWNDRIIPHWSSDIPKWAKPLVNFGDSNLVAQASDQTATEYKQHGHRGFVVYTYRMDAAGWVGPETPAITEDGLHHAR